MDENHIDDLLERYLHLLHDYTTLREELTTLQTGMYQNLARANFAAERGLRFGQDYYDDRMQASRRLAISCDSQDQDQDDAQGSSESRDRKPPVVPSGIVTKFTVIDPAATTVRTASVLGEDSEAQNEAPNPHPHPSPKAGAEAESAEQSAPNIGKVRSAPTPPETDAAAAAAQLRDRNGGTTTGEQHPPNSSPSSPPPEVAEKEKGAGTAATLRRKKSNDPLCWFGLFTPMPLRQAQAQSIRAVEHVIPRLATLNAEMAAVEIEVRRARKRRAKAEAAAAAAVASKPS
ncbi:hypothetical protein F5Y01DRAFT_310527 [Xylaria sp. FL0043]|nr:hypothetical protein F5Y01DRAFT_310527 [Xylaria sp. FL0043]